MEKLNKNLFKFIKFLGHYFVAKRGPSGPIELVYWRVPNLALRFCVFINDYGRSRDRKHPNTIKFIWRGNFFLFYLLLIPLPLQQILQ